MDLLNTLPIDNIIDIALQLDIRSLLSLLCVSKNINVKLDNPTFWSRKIKDCFLLDYKKTVDTIEDKYCRLQWRDAYFLQYKKNYVKMCNDGIKSIQKFNRKEDRIAELEIYLDLLSNTSDFFFQPKKYCPNIENYKYTTRCKFMEFYFINEISFVAYYYKKTFNEDIEDSVLHYVHYLFD